MRTTTVSPHAIPDLEARLKRDPDNGHLLIQYSAALLTANRCDSATVVATRGRHLVPDEALGTLVIGQCLERVGRFEDAIGQYNWFLESSPDLSNSHMVRGRRRIAERERAAEHARRLVAHEQTLGDVPAEANVVGVVPFVVIGDSAFFPLSRGLAQIMLSDLALLDYFRLVERLNVEAILHELELTERRLVDPRTTARVGRMMRAAQIVQGVIAVTSEDQVSLEGNVVQVDGEIAAPEILNGPFPNLMSMEKSLVLSLAERLGYHVSTAERQRILENGTRNLSAFLAYSRGLVAADSGDYATAATQFAAAVHADPRFTAARSEQVTSSAANVASQPIANQAAQLNMPVAMPSDPIANAIADVASTQVERATASTSTVPVSHTASESIGPPVIAPVIINLVFRIP